MDEQDHENQKGHGAKQVNQKIQPLPQPPGQGQNAVPPPHCQENAQRQAQDDGKGRGEQRHIHRLPQRQGEFVPQNFQGLPDCL